MKIKTSDLEGAELDWAVARAVGFEMPEIQRVLAGEKWYPEYSTNWSQGGPLIKKHLITIGPEAVESGPATDIYWFAVRAIWGVLASSEKQWGPRFYSKKSPLIAAMRAIVASELGEEIDVPEELL